MSPKVKRQLSGLGFALLTSEHPLDAVKKNKHNGNRNWVQDGFPEEFLQPRRIYTKCQRKKMRQSSAESKGRQLAEEQSVK